MKQYRKIPLLLTAVLFVLAGMLYLKQISDGQEETKAPEEAQGYNWTIRLTETDAGEQSREGPESSAGEEAGQENREFAGTNTEEETENGTAACPENERTESRAGPAGTDDAGESGRPVETEAAEDRININTAGVEALITLPMIGEKRAEAIIRYRNEHGPFQSPEEITAVAGIGNGIYKRIKDRIRV